MKQVHILNGQTTYCCLPGIPDQWLNDTWVDDISQYNLVTCEACIKSIRHKRTGHHDMEIRRCFLVKHEFLPNDLPQGSLVVQGYLSQDPLIRVKVLNDKAWMIIRGRGDAIEFQSWEYQIPWQDAEQMMNLTNFKLSKISRLLKHNSHVWRLDEYLGPLSGLWMAKIELSDKYESYIAPDWIGKEVSYDSKYYQINLAKRTSAP